MLASYGSEKGDQPGIASTRLSPSKAGPSLYLIAILIACCWHCLGGRNWKHRKPLLRQINLNLSSLSKHQLYICIAVLQAAAAKQKPSDAIAIVSYDEK